MPVKIRLARRGRKKLALYDVIVADSRAPRDGRFIEKIGTYNPNTNPATIYLNEDKAFRWVMNGAQPTDTVRAMLSYRGILVKKHLQIGVIKGALTQEQADSKFEEWKKMKEEKIGSKVESLAKKKTEETQARLAAEAKVKEARAEALRKKAEAVSATEEPVSETETTTENIEVPTADHTSEEAVEETNTAEETTQASEENEPSAEG